MLAEIAFDWEHMSWYFQIDPLAPTCCFLPGVLLLCPLWVPIRAARNLRACFLLHQHRLPGVQDPTLYKVPDDHSFLHAFSKICQVSRYDFYINLGGMHTFIDKEEKNVSKIRITCW